jgi:DNA-binding HxlR family transcriptional regulator
LESVPVSDGSAYREYVPTEKARGLLFFLVALRQWSETHPSANDEPHAALTKNRKIPCLYNDESAL